MNLYWHLSVLLQFLLKCFKNRALLQQMGCHLKYGLTLFLVFLNVDIINAFEEEKGPNDWKPHILHNFFRET